MNGKRLLGVRLPVAAGGRAEEEAIVRRMYELRAADSGATPAARLKLVQNTVRIGEDLHRLNFVGLKLKNLRERHITALSGLWQHGKPGADGERNRPPLSRGFAGKLYMTLCRICIAIDKPGMALPFAEVWPASEPRSQPTRSYRGFRPDDLSDDDYQAILKDWYARPGKRTHYWLFRVVKELGLSCGEAVSLKPHAASVERPGFLCIRRTARRPPRAIALDSEAKLELIRYLIEFAASVRRHRLGWPLEEVKSNENAARVLRTAIYYARDKLAKAAADAGDTPAGKEST